MFIYQYLKLMLGFQFYKLSMTPLASYIVILAPTTFYTCLMNQATLNASSLILIMLPPSGDCSRLHTAFARFVLFLFSGAHACSHVHNVHREHHHSWPSRLCLSRGKMFVMNYDMILSRCCMWFSGFATI